MKIQSKWKKTQGEKIKTPIVRPKGEQQKNESRKEKRKQI